MALAALLCAPLAAGLVLVMKRAPRTAPLLTLLALALVIGLGWLDALSTASAPLTSESWSTGDPAGPPVTFSQALAMEPRLTPEAASDAGVFLSNVYRLRAGQDYYTASIETLSTYNRMRPPGNPRRQPAGAPASHAVPVVLALARQPALTHPRRSRAPGRSGGLRVRARARYVAVPLALAGAALVSALLSRVASSTMLLFTEPWAGALGLVAAALLVQSYARERPRPWLLAAAALAALAAALVREFGAAFLVLGLAAVLAAPETRRPRYWAPWAGGLALAGVAYAAHDRALLAAAAAARVPASGDGAARSSTPTDWGTVGAAGEIGRMLSLHPAGRGSCWRPRWPEASCCLEPVAPSA